MIASPKPELPSEPILRLEPGMHWAPIGRIDVDAGQRFLVTGSADKTIRVWSLKDGQLLKTLRVPLGESDVGKVYSVAITPDGERIAAAGWGTAGGRHQIYVFERASGRIVTRIDGLPNVIDHLAFSPDGRHLVASLWGANGIRIYETEGFREVKSYPDYGGASYWAAFDRTGRLATSSLDGQIRLYDSSLRLSQSKPAPGGKRPFGIAFSPHGARIAVGYDDSTRVDVLDGETLAPLFAADTAGVDSGNISSVAWSADGRHLYAAGRWQPGKYALLRRWADGGRGAYQDIELSQNTIMDLRPLADGRLAFGTGDPSFGILGPDGTIVWRKDPAQADFRAQQDKLAVSRDGTRVAFAFEPFGSLPAKFDLSARRLTLDPEPVPGLAIARTAAPGLEVKDWKDEDTPTFNGKRLPLEQYETSRSLAIAPDDERFLLGTEWCIRLFDRQGQQLWEKPAPGVAWAVNVAGDGRVAIAAFGDGTIRWFRLEDGEELLAFFPHRDRERWVVWTPKGYYMASPGGEELIGWHLNRGLDTPEFYSAGRFRDRFHRPDVVALVLEELDVDKALARANREADITPAAQPLRAPSDIAQELPPIIEIIDPANGADVAQDHVQVTYLITGPVGERVPALSAHLNGQLVQTLAGPPVTFPANGYRGVVTVPLAGWLQSEEAIIALIAEGRRASDPAQVKLRWVSQAVHAEIAKPTLFVLAIGVSQYERNPPRNLQYASKDAADVVEILQRQKGGLYGEVKPFPLIDKDATSSAIIAGLRWLREQVAERDVVIVFFSGHGALEEVYHFLPHDVDVRTQDDLAVTAIRQDQLRAGLRALHRKGAKVLAFFDTCHSGAGFEPTKGLPPDIDKLAAELRSPENGVIVFTSSTGREVSKEDPSWEHGAFTEALLEAFAGKADRAGRGVLRVSDLQAFLPSRVRELTGNQQNPQIYVPFEKLWEAPIAVVPH
jgi:WD40 repeat protein